MLVFVKNKYGESLMPCKPRKARLLLKEGKAKIISYKPFTIQLLFGSSGYKQSINLGIDLGSKNIGVAIVSEDRVLAKGEIELRQDVSKLIDIKSSLRRNRRAKLRYRKPRFLNRVKSKKKGWLPPSTESKINNNFMWIDRFIGLLPSPKLSIEVGKFDAQKVKNPDISGKDYQEGDSYGYFSTRYYVFARDNYTCQVCKKKDGVFQTHHIIYTSKGGTDKADNLITVCSDCHTHKNHQEGEIFYNWMLNGKKLPSYREFPYMNTLKLRVFAKYPSANITYGNITTPNRKGLSLDKTHYNDAIAITGIGEIKTNVDTMFKIKQFRKKKRSLHESIPRKGRKAPNINQTRNNKNVKERKGLHLGDKVRVFGKVGFISGFDSSNFYITDIEGNYITMPDVKYKQVSQKYIKKLEHNNNWLYISNIIP